MLWNTAITNVICTINAYNFLDNFTFVKFQFRNNSSLFTPVPRSVRRKFKNTPKRINLLDSSGFLILWWLFVSSKKFLDIRHSESKKCVPKLKFQNSEHYWRIFKNLVNVFFCVNSLSIAYGWFCFVPLASVTKSSVN